MHAYIHIHVYIYIYQAVQSLSLALHLLNSAEAHLVQQRMTLLQGRGCCKPTQSRDLNAQRTRSRGRRVEDICIIRIQLFRVPY